MTIANDLRERTFSSAPRITLLCRSLPASWDVREIGSQLLRAGMGATGNYWSACRGRSRREFIAKLGVAEDEAAESVLWLMLIVRSGVRKDHETKDLLGEGREIAAILSASHKTANENRRKNQPTRKI